MSDLAEFKVIGREEFVLPFGAVGMNYGIANTSEELEDIIDDAVLNGCGSFIVDESIADISIVKRYEENGYTLFLLNPWDSSEQAGEKIRMASIKAIGTELKEQPDAR